MKRLLALSLVAALLGGCAIVPLGYGDGWRHRQYRDDGYRRDHNYYPRYDGRGYRDDGRGR